MAYIRIYLAIYIEIVEQLVTCQDRAALISVI